MTEQGFTLEQQAAKPEPPRTHGNCRWFLYATGQTGRLRRTVPGQCTWRAPWPDVWPEAYRNYGLMREYPTHPRPSSVWPMDETTCPCWARGAK